VAAFCLEQATLGVDPQQIMAQLGAIEKSHDKFNLPNPVRTAVVDIVLEQIVKSEPPRSWNKDEKAEWAKLPARVRDAISRHEKDRDRELRRLQNQAAENRRHDGAAKPIKTEGTEHYGQI
jgi:hypothetical protein